SAAEENPFATPLVEEQPGAHRDRQTAGDLGHARQDRHTAPVVLDDLQAYCGDLTGVQGIEVFAPGRGQRPETEHDLASAELFVLAGLGALDADDELGPTEPLRACEGNRRPGRLILRVGVSRLGPGARLDPYAVALLGQRF